MDDKHSQRGMTAFREPARAAEAFLLCTPAGRVRYASGGLRRIIEEDLTGRNLNDFLADDQAARLIAQSMAGQGGSFRCEIRGQTFRCEAQPWEKDGMQITLFPVNRAGEKLGGVFSARIVAREMNNSLAVLLPALQLMEESALPEQEQYLAMMRLHVFRMMRMSRNLEDMSLVESGSLRADLREENLTALCGQLMEQIRPYCQTLNIDLQVRLPQGPVMCWADGEKVQRMVLNLVANAMEAQRTGGVISFILRQREADTVVLSVTDQGGGISGELMGRLAQEGHLSEPAEKSGLGMGLALTRAFAEAHKGQLMLMSGEQGGLSARIVLPVGEAPPHDVDQLHAWRTAYGAGVDLVKVELSAAAGRELYGRQQPVGK